MPTREMLRVRFEIGLEAEEFVVGMEVEVMGLGIVVNASVAVVMVAADTIMARSLVARHQASSARQRTRRSTSGGERLRVRLDAEGAGEPVREVEVGGDRRRLDDLRVVETSGAQWGQIDLLDLG